jgi:hypothetical protein
VFIRGFSNSFSFNSLPSNIYFPEKVGDGSDLEQGQKQHFWIIPAAVKQVALGADVRVTGAFHALADIRFEREDREASVLYGTDLQRWADANNLAGLDLREWHYSRVENLGGAMVLKNLSFHNPFSSFAWVNGAPPA